jgi:hypothetical protein
MAKRMTPSQIIDLLGGTSTVKSICGCSGLNVVSNWRRAGIPPVYFGKLVRASDADAPLTYEDLETQAIPKVAKRKKAAA